MPAAVTKMSRVILPRNPDLDGKETQRIIMRDPFNRIRGMIIAYKDKSEGTIERDESGKPTSVKMTLLNGITFEGTPTDDRSVLVSAKAVDAKEKLLVEEANQPGGKGYVHYFQPDGVTLLMTEDITPERTVRTLLQNDGKTPLAQLEYISNGTRLTTLRLYSDKGVLLYEEKGGEGNVTRLSYNGVAYNAQGKAANNVLFLESIYRQGDG